MATARPSANPSTGSSFTTDVAKFIDPNTADPGSHVQRLEILSPDGALHQRIVSPFDADAERFNRREHRSGRISVETILPVRGTWITQYSLFGNWIVHVHLDRATDPVATATLFVGPH